MRVLALWCALASFSAFGAEARLDERLKAVENRYNRAQSLKLTFRETYKAQQRPEQTESGTLYLRKPGRMRWEYTSPPGKVFVSDGKNVSLYTPENRRLERSRFKETEDMRAPLAFLLGKLNFYKEFRSFTLRGDGADAWVEAEPNSPAALYAQVAFLVAPDAHIRRLRVVGQDGSVLNFEFHDERLNVPVSPELFAFRPPPGTETIEGEP